MWTDPFIIRALIIMSSVLVLVGIASRNIVLLCDRWERSGCGTDPRIGAAYTRLRLLLTMLVSLHARTR